jgi:hypothetical protein
MERAPAVGPVRGDRFAHGDGEDRADATLGLVSDVARKVDRVAALDFLKALRKELEHARPRLLGGGRGHRDDHPA